MMILNFTTVLMLADALSFSLYLTIVRTWFYNAFMEA